MARAEASDNAVDSVVGRRRVTVMTMPPPDRAFSTRSHSPVGVIANSEVVEPGVPFAHEKSARRYTRRPLADQFADSVPLHALPSIGCGRPFASMRSRATTAPRAMVTRSTALDLATGVTQTVVAAVVRALSAVQQPSHACQRGSP